MKFLHLADIHLDSPLVGLARMADEGTAERIRGATRRALENAVGLAIDARVDFVVIVGDTYDRDWRDYQTGLFFIRQLQKLSDAGIHVYLVLGNHDARSVISRSLRFPSNTVCFAADAPQSVLREDLGVALHGRSYPDRAVPNDFVLTYPKPIDGMLNIGLLHTSLDGTLGHDDYAPTTPEVLRARGYDYWALGHIHKRTIVSERPWIVYPGNLQGRHAREIGPKGCTLVSAHDGRIVSVDHHETDVVRWAHARVDVSSAESTEDVAALIRSAAREAAASGGGRFTVVRAILEGDSDLHAGLVDARAELTRDLQEQFDLEGEKLWLEKVVVETSRRAPSTAAATVDPTALDEVLRAVAAIRDDPAEMERLREHLRPLFAKLPRSVREGEGGVDPAADESLRSALDEVEQSLPVRLRGVTS